MRFSRLDHCRWGNDKNFCSQCPCHCYKPDMRVKIKEVMRYSRTTHYALSSACGHHSRY
ncbi:MAG: nitrous oxide-stimulated promoter family protein [Acutalibacteraceae bacterium]